MYQPQNLANPLHACPKPVHHIFNKHSLPSPYFYRSTVCLRKKSPWIRRVSDFRHDRANNIIVMPSRRSNSGTTPITIATHSNFL
jgi:hypothetical protein